MGRESVGAEFCPALYLKHAENQHYKTISVVVFNALAYHCRSYPSQCHTKAKVFTSVYSVEDDKSIN